MQWTILVIASREIDPMANRPDTDAASNSDERFGQQTAPNVREAKPLWSSDQAGINMQTGWSASTRWTGKNQDKGERGGS